MAMSEAELLSTTDAMVWAKEWVRTAREIQARGGDVFDEGWMVGWFANAMETAAREARHNLRDDLTEDDAP
jgi:hypothetical protein